MMSSDSRQNENPLKNAPPSCSRQAVASAFYRFTITLQMGNQDVSSHLVIRLSGIFGK